MITLDKLTYNLLNMARGGVLSDDENISFRQVEFWVHNTRALLIRQDIQKKRAISGNIIQVLPCLDVDIVDASLCPCTVPTGCSVLRTRKTIPKPLEIDEKDLITKVSSIGLTDRGYTLINLFRASWVGYNKYAKNNPKAFYFDGYIWLIQASDPVEKINVYGVFEDPTELAAYVDCQNQPCYSNDMNYPVSAWMLPMMEKLIMESNFRIIATTQTDSTGNAKTDTESIATK